MHYNSVSNDFKDILKKFEAQDEHKQVTISKSDH